MRGLAEIGRRCGECGSANGDGSGLCLFCRARKLGLASRKYRFTPELIDELRIAYAGNKRQITVALDRMQRRTGWPRHAFKLEAQRRGWTRDERRPWTAAEIALLREVLGTMPTKRIAARLRRPVQSVEAKAEKLRLSRRITEGYTITDLAAVFGEHHHKVRRWIDRKLLGRPMVSGNEVRVAEHAVVRFIREHAREYDLRRVDQDWFKAMVFAGRS